MALESGDAARIAAQAQAMGLETQRADTEFIAKFTTFGYDRIDAALTGGKSPMQWLSELRQQDTVTRMPGNYYLVMRTVFLLRGLAALMHVDVSVARYWQPFAKRFLESYVP